MLREPKKIRDYSLFWFGVILFMLVVIVITLTGYKANHPKEEVYCRGGYKFAMMGDWKSINDHQIIGENGGGVPCQ